MCRHVAYNNDDRRNTSIKWLVNLQGSMYYKYDSVAVYNKFKGYMGYGRFYTTEQQAESIAA